MSALSSVDLPAFGRPTSATCPARRGIEWAGVVTTSRSLDSVPRSDGAESWVTVLLGSLNRASDNDSDVVRATAVERILQQQLAGLTRTGHGAKTVSDLFIRHVFR